MGMQSVVRSVVLFCGANQGGCELWEGASFSAWVAFHARPFLVLPRRGRVRSCQSLFLLTWFFFNLDTP